MVLGEGNMDSDFDRIHEAHTLIARLAHENLDQNGRDLGRGLDQWRGAESEFHPRIL
jgi:hypothetical protein